MFVFTFTINGEIAWEATLIKHQILTNKHDMEMEIIRLGDSMFSNQEKIVREYKKEDELLNRQFKCLLKILNLKKKLAKSGGVISTNEEIYINNTQTLEVVRFLSLDYNSAMDEIKKIYTKNIRILNSNWSELENALKGNTPDLSHDELYEIMASVGCTKDKILNQPVNFMEEKIRILDKVNQEFENLITGIKAQINILVKKDAELANQVGIKKGF